MVTVKTEPNSYCSFYNASLIHRKKVAQLWPILKKPKFVQNRIVSKKKLGPKKLCFHCFTNVWPFFKKSVVRRPTADADAENTNPKPKKSDGSKFFIGPNQAKLPPLSAQLPSHLRRRFEIAETVKKIPISNPALDSL